MQFERTNLTELDIALFSQTILSESFWLGWRDTVFTNMMIILILRSYLSLYIYIYIYTYVCVCVCALLLEKNSEKIDPFFIIAKKINEISMA